METQEIFFKNFIDVLESLYLKGNEEKRSKILEYDIVEDDEHIDEWNKKKVVKNKQGKKEDKKEEKEEK